MRLLALAVVLALIPVGAARADDPVDKLAHFARADAAALDQVRAFTLPGARDYTHAVFAREPLEGGARRHLVLMRCDARRCYGTSVWLTGSDELRVVGLIDLAGAAREIPVDDVGRIELPGTYVRLPQVDGGTKRMRWPALVVVEASARTETVDDPRGRITGSDRDHRLVVISLRGADRGHVVLRESIVALAPRGAGFTASYRLADERGRTPHTILATEQRHLDNRLACLPPPPTEHRFAWKDDRYQRVTDLGLRSGCH